MLLVAQNNLADANIRPRTGVAAAWAAITAQMAVGHEVVFVFALAFDAVWRVGKFRNLRFIERRVDTIENNVVWHVVVKTRNERIVCIQTQNGVRAVLRADAQLSERMRDLAVAVKLVAEDVRVYDHLCINVLADEFQRRFVRLDERMRIFAAACERGVDGEFRRDAGQEVRAGFVCKVRDSSVLPRLLDHTRGRGFSVGARDDHSRHVLCKFTQQVWAEFERHTPGKIRAASA